MDIDGRQLVQLGLDCLKSRQSFCLAGLVLFLAQYGNGLEIVDHVAQNASDLLVLTPFGVEGIPGAEVVDVLVCTQVAMQQGKHMLDSGIRRYTTEKTQTFQNRPRDGCRAEIGGILKVQVGGSLVLVLVASEKTAYASRITRAVNHSLRNTSRLEKAYQSVLGSSRDALRLTPLLDLRFFAAEGAMSKDFYSGLVLDVRIETRCQR